MFKSDDNHGALNPCAVDGNRRCSVALVTEIMILTLAAPVPSVHSMVGRITIDAVDDARRWSRKIDGVYSRRMTRVDLNLLPAFISIYETRNLTRTAELLHVTQPTVSHTLGRLRKRFNDPLFLRGRAGMEPTTLADQLYDGFKEALSHVDTTVERFITFDPATSTRRFRIALTDLGELSLLPRILQRISARAPHVELEVVPLEISSVARWLTLGTVDAAIASHPLEGELSSTVLRTERYVCLFRKDNPVARDGTITLEDFSAAGHIVVSSTTGHALAENAMSELGISRNVVLTLRRFSPVPHLVASGDTIAVVPSGLAEDFIGNLPLEIAELPFDVPEFEVQLYTRLRERQPATAWFHGTVAEALRLDDGARHST